MAASVGVGPQVKSQSQQFSTLNDSSDDEIPVPMVLSALTKALLSDGQASDARPAAPAVAKQRPSSPPPRPSSQIMTKENGLAMATASASALVDREDNRRESIRLREARRHVRTASITLPSPRPSSPVRSRDTSPAPRKRVVRLSGTPGIGSFQQGVRRSLSASTQAKKADSRERTDEKKHQQQQHAPPAKYEGGHDINTPVVPVRTVRIAVGSSGQKGRSEGSSTRSIKRSGSGSDQEMQEDPQTVNRTQGPARDGSVPGHSAAGRREEAGAQSSMRVKRIGKVAGSFLSGPARRGRRRQSEEDAEDQGDGDLLGSNQGLEAQLPRDVESAGADIPASSFLASSFRDFAASGSPVSAKDSARAVVRRKASSANVSGQRLRSADNGHLELVYRIPAPPPEILSTHDKENEDAAGIKHVSASIAKEQGKPLAVPVGDVQVAQAGQSSPSRKALAPVSQNTPHRPVLPPPPKMSVVETATTAAGAATAAQATRKRQMLLRVNGRTYTRIDCIGRGGSAKVYRVSAENGKMFALKRVSLENTEESTVKGFKGEIDLLKRLHGVDRVIQLIDHELNLEKQTLSVLMEAGELDFNNLLKSRQSTSEGAKFDPVFIRFYWKEMLECVQAVHAKEVVHSDLKPANFVLVQGRLKLIDFGIANVIQTEMTVNVHRETQIGTPNYMSPESLMDSNQYAFTSAQNGKFCVPPPLQHHRGMPKLMKLGKPSDVWSLGCILYQMVYGLPPFGKIANQMSRCQAIINWSYAIDYPDVTEDGSRVPPSVLRTIKRCLNREHSERPTCDELLAPTDPFLYPQEFEPAILAAGESKVLPMTDELLSRIIQSVVQRCRERLPTEGEAISTWPNAYWASVKKAVLSSNGKA